MGAQIVLHRGGWQATRADLASVPVPDATDTHCPVPYGRLVDEVQLHIPRFGLRVVDEAYALARDGAQMFGVLTCENGSSNGCYRLALAMRNSYDRSLAAELVVGARVFVCDNLSFHGEISVHRKNTRNIFRDLPDLIYRMLSAVSVMRERMDAEFAAMQAATLTDAGAHDLMIRAVRAEAFPASKLPKVIEHWERPSYEDFKPRNAWSLYNAFTAVQKSRAPSAQVDDTLRLTQVFRDALAL